MSDERPASDWWLANDGRWYPPEQHPDHQQQLPPPPEQPPGPGWWKASDGAWYPPSAVPGEGQDPADGPTVIGDAGGSAKRQADTIRRRADHWEAGAAGEERTAQELTRLRRGYYVLHDLHVPGSSANIDHLVVGPTGVWLIDTKAYSVPLRYGDGTVWRGRYPLRKETAAVANYASAVSEVLRLPVIPVLCFVDNIVPPEASLLGSVRLVALDDLLALIAGGSGVRIDDVDSVARLARTLRTPTPSPRAGRPDDQPAARRSGASRTAPSSGRPANRLKAKKKSRSGSPFLAMTIAIGLLIGACAALSAVGNSISSSTTTIAPPPLDGPMIDVPSPTPGISAMCTAGEGWQVGFVWPVGADPQYEPVAYEVVSLTPDIVVEPKLWLGRNGLPEPSKGVAPSTRIIVAVQGILADGTRLAPTTRERTVPDWPC